MIRPRRWTTGDIKPQGEGIGLLVLDGLLIRGVDVEGEFGSEVLGEGDLLRPWQEAHPPTLSVRVGWRVIEPTRIAVLDQQFAFRASRFPQLTGRLVGRALQGSRHLAVNMAIVHHAHVDARVHMILWHLAGRWGELLELEAIPRSLATAAAGGDAHGRAAQLHTAATGPHG